MGVREFAYGVVRYRAVCFESCRPLINNPPPLNTDSHSDPNARALKGGGLLIMGLQP